ncbi:MAG TPA: dihydrolipoamide acetyltransferase family protein [Pyrinomonadaceae bacterium]|nr:dihydrolipoamide acetyltransferase family protein [Pyrinomonadaceae bacterium]
MSTEVVMPQMGESIAEGTITRWLKKVGEHVERDEPLFEISTDKVDAEIPSPAAGILTEIKFKEGETVEVNKVVAVLNGEGASSPSNGGASAAEISTAPASQAAVLPETPPQPPQPPATQVEQPKAQAATQPTTTTTPAITTAPASSAAKSEESKEAQPSSKPAQTSSSANEGDGREQTVEELRRTKSSPLVRNIAREHGIDISRLEGTGMSGRVTKNDILSFIESGAALSPQQAMQASTASAPASPQAPVQAPPLVPPTAEDRVEQMSVMRKKIAEHMTLSRRTSAHVTTVYEIDMTRIARLRDQHRNSFLERTGTKLTFMPFIFQAVTIAIRKFPVFNAQVSGDQIIYKRDINLGMAVALDWGLIVPVIKRADDLSISGLARAANDLAERARAKQLKPDEVAGGTFTITNPGVFGGLFGTPIINQPQVAILGVGAIEKRPKVITSAEGDDLIAIRQMAYFALTFDHRIIDGSDAEKFLGYVKQLLETGNWQL